MKSGFVPLFDKHFKNDEYEIFFSSTTGLEAMRGINDHPDPFSLVLPSLIDIGIMGTCKHKCTFCYQGHENKPNMKLKNFKKIIDQVKHHVNQVALGGRGDPNKHENFEEIISYCRDNGVIPNYTTSGMELTDREVEISKQCGAVAVSEYQKDYTYKAIQTFINAGIKTNIHLIFSKGSFDDCINMLHGTNIWGRKKNQRGQRDSSLVDIDKLNAVIFLLFKPQGAGKSMLGLIPNQYQYKTFAERIFTPKCKFKVGMDSCLVNHVLQYVTPIGIQKMSIDSCEGARMSAYITPDMRMMACSFSDPKFSIKINKRNDINYIWNRSNIFNHFRKVLKSNQISCPLGL